MSVNGAWTTDLKAVANWASELDAWTVYSAEMLRELDDFGMVATDAGEYWILGPNSWRDDPPVHIQTPTARQVWAQMQADPRGGSMSPEALEKNDRLVMGLSISNALCRLFGIEVRGYMGRRFQHIANIEALAKFADSKATDAR